MAKSGSEPIVVKASSNVYTGLLVAGCAMVAGGIIVLILRAKEVLEAGIF